MSKRMKALIAVLAAILVLTVGGTAMVMAQEEEPPPTPETEANGLLARVAEILGISQEELTSGDASWVRRAAEPALVQSAAAMGDDVHEALLLDGFWYTLVAILDQELVNDDDWVEMTHDLTAWRGRSLAIYFNAYNDGLDSRTWMYVDDVSIQVCPPKEAQE